MNSDVVWRGKKSAAHFLRKNSTAFVPKLERVGGRAGVEDEHFERWTFCLYANLARNGKLQNM